MGRSLEDWGDDLEDHPGRTLLTIGIWVVIGVFVLVSLVWGLKTGFSYWWGQAGATQQKNSSQNFVEQESRFHNDQNAVTADQAKIVAAKAALTQFTTANPNYATSFTLSQQYGNLTTTVTGLQQGCQNEVADYNDAASEFLSADWRDAGLPSILSPNLCN